MYFDTYHRQLNSFGGGADMPETSRIGNHNVTVFLGDLLIYLVVLRNKILN